MFLTPPDKAPKVRTDELIILSVTDEPKSCSVPLHTPLWNLHPASLTTLGRAPGLWLGNMKKDSVFLNWQLTHMSLQCGFPGAQSFIMD